MRPNARVSYHLSPPLSNPLIWLGEGPCRPGTHLRALAFWPAVQERSLELNSSRSRIRNKGLATSASYFRDTSAVERRLDSAKPKKGEGRGAARGGPRLSTLADQSNAGPSSACCVTEAASSASTAARPE